MSFTLRDVGTFAAAQSTARGELTGVVAGDLIVSPSVAYNIAADFTGVAVGIPPDPPTPESALTAASSLQRVASGLTGASAQIWSGLAASSSAKMVDVTVDEALAWIAGNVLAFAHTGTVAVFAAAGRGDAGNIVLEDLPAGALVVVIQSNGGPPDNVPGYEAVATDDGVEASLISYLLSAPGGDEVIPVNAMGVAVAFTDTASGARRKLAAALMA